jgi:hypothetical protein
MRKGLIAATAALVAGTSGLGAGYYLWGIPTRLDRRTARLPGRST